VCGLGITLAMETKKARQLLEERRDELENVARAATEQGSLDESQRDSAGELTAADHHPADLATDTVERELDLSVRESVEARMTDIERALGRLEKGTYGVCAACNKPIPDDRLEARPEAEYCIEHQPS
jgi:RNA polymerase-binding protein DksA